MRADDMNMQALVALATVNSKARQGAFDMALAITSPQWPQADRERLAKCYAVRVLAQSALCSFHDYMQDYDCPHAAEVVMAISRFFHRTDDNVDAGMIAGLDAQERQAWALVDQKRHVQAHHDDAIRVMQKHQLARQVASG